LDKTQMTMIYKDLGKGNEKALVKVKSSEFR